MGYLINMPPAGKTDTSFKFNLYTSDILTYNYDTNNMIITLTQEDKTLVKSILEFDTSYPINNARLNYFEFSVDFTMQNINGNAGNGLSLSFYDEISYNNLWTYNAIHGGYTIYIDASNQTINFYDQDQLITSVSFTTNLITSSEIWHTCCLKVNDYNDIISITLLIDSITLFTFNYNILRPIGKYFTIGGWTTSYTMTQKIKNFSLYGVYDQINRKLQILGDSYLKNTIIDGSLQCNGDMIIDGKITTTKDIIDISTNLQLTNIKMTGNLSLNGNIIYMPSDSNSNFDFSSYLIGNDFNFDRSNMVIQMNNGSIGINQSIIEFDLSRYIDQSILTTFTFSFDFTIYNNTLNTARGMWLYFYNQSPNDITYPGYLQAHNGMVIYFDVMYNLIIMYDNNNEFYTDISSNISSLITTNEQYNNLILNVKNYGTYIHIILTINDTTFINYKYITDISGNYFGIGSINGSQKIKNIIIKGEYTNLTDKFAVFGNSLIKGNTDIYGALHINDNATIGYSYSNIAAPLNGLIIAGNVGIGLTNPNFNLDVSGSIHANTYYGDGSNLTNLGALHYFNNCSIGLPYIDILPPTDCLIIAGNVGIGLTNPNYNLDVSGNIKAIKYYGDGSSLIGINNNTINLINDAGFITNTLNAFDYTNLASKPYIPLFTSDLNNDIGFLSVHSNIDATIITGIINNNNLPSNISISGDISNNNLYLYGTISSSNNLIYNVANNYEHIWQYNTTEIMRLNTTGLGINNYNPIYPLDVNGIIKGTYFYGDGSNLTNITQLNNATIGLAFNNIIAPTDGLIVAGNVGIGITSPIHELDINGNINFTGNIYNNGSLYNKTQWTSIDSNIYFINNVGIGLTSPNFILDVNGDSNINGNLNINSLNSGSIICTDVSSSNISITSSLSANVVNLNTLVATDWIYANGKIVIQNDLDGGVNKGIYLLNTTNTDWVQYLSSSGGIKSTNGNPACTSIDGRTSYHIRYRCANNSNQGIIWENASETCLMSLAGDSGNLLILGNVGIGTSNPSYNLDVNGSIKCSYFYGDGSNITNLVLPTKLSQFTNDTLYISNSLNSFNYNNLSNIPYIPTKVSDLINDTGFISINNTNASNLSSGTLNQSRLPTTSVISGSYGDSSTIPIYTVDSYGRLTSSTNVSIVIESTSVIGLVASAIIDTTNASNISTGTLPIERLPISSITAGSYGDSTYIPSFTVDDYGRLTAVNNIQININSNMISGLSNSATIDTTNAANISIGTLNSNRLPTTSIIAGSYGSASSFTTFSVDSYGRLTNASSIPFTSILNALNTSSITSSTDLIHNISDSYAYIWNYNDSQIMNLSNDCLNITGNIYANSYYGDGSNLTNIIFPTTYNSLTIDNIIINQTCNFQNNGSSIMTINNNIGIGTSNPTYKLDVSGNTNITGDINISNNINFNGSLYQNGVLWSSNGSNSNITSSVTSSILYATETNILNNSIFQWLWFGGSNLIDIGLSLQNNIITNISKSGLFNFNWYTLSTNSIFFPIFLTINYNVKVNYTIGGTNSDSSANYIGNTDNNYILSSNDSISFINTSGEPIYMNSNIRLIITRLSSFDNNNIPEQPIISSIIPTNCTVTIFITPNSNVQNYTAISSPDNITVSSTTSIITINGLTNGTNYSFKVFGINSLGNGIPINTSSIIPIPVPDQPIITNTIAGNTTITLYFTSNNAISYLINNISCSSSPYTITDLTNGTPYIYSIVAINTYGNSLPTLTSQIIPYTIPNTPTITHISNGFKQATISFTDSFNGGSSITSYTVISTPDNIITNGASSPITIIDLTVGTSYSFTIYATNNAGNSNSSSPSNSIIPYGLPNPPTIGTATLTDSSASISFTPSSYNGYSTITSYTVKSSPDNLSNSGITSPIIINNLSYGINYTFTIIAINAAGNSIPSSVSNTVLPITIPDVPTIDTATAGITSASIYFIYPIFNGGSTITSYTIKSNPDNLLVNGTSSPITIYNLTANTSYTFTIKATNIVGSSSYSSSSNTVIPYTISDTPTINNAIAGSASATITFTPPSFNGGSNIINYLVTSSPDNITTTASTSPIAIGGLTVGTSYTFTIIAINAAGNSLPSSSSNAIIPY